MVSFSSERNGDLYEAYKRKRKELGEHVKYMTRRAVVQLTVESPAKKFYVTPETALKIINRVDKTGSPGKFKDVTQSKFIEIHTRYHEIRSKNPLLSKYALADMVVNSEAPKFYLEWEAALSIIYEIEKQK